MTELLTAEPVDEHELPYATPDVPRARWSGWLLALGVMAVAALPRLVAISSAYDVTQDEVNYVDLSRSALQGHFPPRFENAPFTLHPPLLFIMASAWYRIVGTAGSYFHLIAEARTFNVILAVASAGLIYGITTRMAGRACGVAAALLFAVDPYVLRQNGRVMLETGTVWWVLAGVFVLAPVLADRVRRPALSAALGGLLLGAATVTNDIAAVLVVIPLVVAVLWSWGPRRAAAVALVSALIPYGLYLGALGWVGQLGVFETQSGHGLRRMLGLEQTTGFNRAGSPSLLHTLLSQMTTFGVTYTLCGVGVISALYLLFRDDRTAVRYLATMTLAGTVTLLYAVTLGTIEEQFFYYLYVPALAVIPIAARLWLSRQSDPVGARARAATAIGMLVLTVGYGALIAVQVRTTPDDSQQRLAAWFTRSASAQRYSLESAPVAADTEATVLVLERTGIPAILATSPEDVRANGAQYFVELSAEEHGYSALTPAQLAYFTTHGAPVFSLRQRTYGTVTVWRTTDPAAW